MNLTKGAWAIAALFAAYAALYWHHVITAAMPFGAQVSYFAGSCSVICMTLGLVLSARPRLAEAWFGGLDRMYKLHKYLGVAALLLFIAHYATVSGEPEAGAAAAAASEEEGLPIDLFGLVAMVGFTLLIIVTLNRKIPYHRWFATHRLMGLFFLVVSVHVALVLYDGQELAFLSAPGAALALALLAGLAAAAYKQLIYPRKAGHAFTLAAVNPLERATEVVLQPKNGALAFEPGQFAFISIDSDGFREAHPFTISSGAKENGLRFTTKVLGDYTRRVRDDLVAGVDVAVEGPYGRFNPLRGPEKQVWVAGGIGITPFLSVLRSMVPGHGKTIRLYYCVRDASEALFFDELEARAADVDGVTIVRFDSDAGKRINAYVIRDDVGGALMDWSFWLCGPKPLVAAVDEGLRREGVRSRRIYKEEFEFR